MTGKNLPDDHHIVRYVKPTLAACKKTVPDTLQTQIGAPNPLIFSGLNLIRAIFWRSHMFFSSLRNQRVA